MNETTIRRVDHTALRTNQASIIAVLSLAFILDQPLLAIFCGGLMLLGSLRSQPAFMPVYRLLLSIGWLRPDMQADHPEPHRFAQAVGSAVLLASTLGFTLGAHTIGWILNWVVIILAGLNLFLGFCLGCAMYFWLARWGVPGFDKTAIEQKG